MKTQTNSIPFGWSLNLLDEISVRGTGHTPDRSVSAYWGGGIKWISLKDTRKLDKTYVSETEEDISTTGIQNSSAVLHPAGTVVLCREAGVGKSAIITQEMAVSQDYVVWTCGERLYNHYLYYWLQWMKPEFERVAAGSTIKSIGLPYFRKLRIIYPPLIEQHRIVQILTTWDRAIDLTAQLIAAKQERKRGLMQQLLMGRKRYSRFVRSDSVRHTSIGQLPGEWDFVSIGDIAEQFTERNPERRDLPVLSCTKYEGLVDSLTYFGRQIFSQDTSTYKLVRRHQFAYATNHIEEGSIGYQDLYDGALVSPMYTVFATSPQVNDRFLYALLKTETYRQIFERRTSASVDRRGSLRWPEFARITVPLPSLAEQTAIADVLEASDQEVALLKRQLALLTQQKQGLMQQLMTGKMRVTA